MNSTTCPKCGKRRQLNHPSRHSRDIKVVCEDCREPRVLKNIEFQYLNLKSNGHVEAIITADVENHRKVIAISEDTKVKKPRPDIDLVNRFEEKPE